MSGEPKVTARFSRTLAIIIVLAVTGRLAALLLFQNTLGETVYEYDTIARYIVQGDGFAYDNYGTETAAPTAWMAPVYPYLLALYYIFAGDNLFGFAIIQALLGGVTCFLIGVLGRRLETPSVGLIAAMIFACYPEMILMPIKMVPESWLLAMLLLLLYVGTKYVEARNSGLIILVGLICGIAALTKESALLYPIGLILWFGLKQMPRKKWLIDSGLLLLVTMCVILPWSIRNYTAFDEIVPIRTGFWYNVWKGNHPGGSGTARNFDKVSVDLVLDEDYRAIIESELTGNEYERDQIYKKYALLYIRDDIPHYVRLCLNRIYYFWIFDPTHPLTGHPLYWLPWSGLLILSFIGLIATWDRIADYSFWYLLFLITTFMYGSTMVLPRYRIPMLPGLILLAAVGILKIYGRVRRRDA